MSFTGEYTRHSADYFRGLRLNVLFFAVPFFAAPRIRAFLTDGFFLAGLPIVFAVPRTGVFLADRFFLTGLATVS
jgi:hypothetical protein